MRFMRLILAMALLHWSALPHLSTSVAGQNASQGSESDDLRTARAFLAELKNAVGQDDHKAVAAMIQYPILINTGTLRIPFADPAALAERYDLIFSSALKATIAASAFAAPGQQRSPTTAVTSGTAMTIAGGYIGAEKIDGVFRITWISLPPRDGAAAPPGPAGSLSPMSPARRAAPRRGAERLTVRGRLRTAQATGTLAAGETRSYVVWGGQGQLLDVRVDGVRGREILLRVVHARTGAPVDARAGEGVRRWSGRLSAGADYRIELKRGEPGPASAPQYVLVVTVK
jgi:hypothetical protein